MSNFRNIAAAFRRQDWATVLVEFVLVIVGVLIALRLDQFAEDRRVDLQELNFLELVQADIARDIEDLANLEMTYGAVRNFGDDVLATIDGEPCVDNCWSKLLAFFQSSQWMDVRLNSSTYEEIKRTGFPRDKSLKDMLVRYYSLGEQRYIVAGLPRYREIVRSIIPVNVQDYLWARCWEMSGRRQNLISDCEAGIGNPEARRIVDELRAHPEIRTTLMFWLSTVSVINQTIPPQIDEAEELIETLSDYIDNAR
jgi:hypothetical protein